MNATNMIFWMKLEIVLCITKKTTSPFKIQELWILCIEFILLKFFPTIPVSAVYFK